jgi:energy-coupling factor transporter ATP-binding protein EcfA2
MVSSSHFTTQASHIGIWGESGSGKSTELNALLEIAFRQKKKTIDLCDFGRLENLFKALPNEDRWMYERAIKILKRFSKKRKNLRRLFKRISSGEIKLEDAFPWKPEAYKVECFIPAASGTPDHIPNIFKPFRIRFHELSIMEIKILLGKLTRDQSDAVDYIFDMLPEPRTFKSFVETVRRVTVDCKVKINKKCFEICDSKQALSLYKKVDRLHQLGILTDDKEDPLILDLDAILKDTGTITCFSFFNIDDENLCFLLYGYLLRKIYKMRTDQLSGRWQYPPLVIGIREIHLLAPARSQMSSYAYEGQKISCENLCKIFREPRDIKLWVVGDSQDPLQINPMIRSKFKTLLIFQVSKATLDRITEFVYVDHKSYKNLQNAQIGIHAIRSIPQEGNWKNRTGFHYPMCSLPPRSLCKNPERLFFKEWEDRGLPFIDWKDKFKANKTLIEWEKTKPEEETRDQPTLRELKIFEQNSTLVLRALNEYKDHKVDRAVQLLEDPVLQALKWNKQELLRILYTMAKANPPLIYMEKNGRAWRIRAVDQPTAQVLTSTAAPAPASQ